MSKAKAKPTKAWAVVEEDGLVSESSINGCFYLWPTRDEARANLWGKQRLVRVSIVPEETKP